MIDYRAGEITEPLTATCREYLGLAGWCPKPRAASGDYCVRHTHARAAASD